MFVFRNANHIFYFLLTFPMVVLYIFLFLTNRKEMLLLLLCPIILHTIITILAVRTVVILKQESSSFSIDCVWYNGTLLLIYLLMFVFCFKSY